MIYLLILSGEQVISLDILQEPQQQKRFQKKNSQESSTSNAYFF